MCMRMFYEGKGFRIFFFHDFSEGLNAFSLVRERARAHACMRATESFV